MSLKNRLARAEAALAAAELDQLSPELLRLSAEWHEAMKAMALALASATPEGELQDAVADSLEASFRAWCLDTNFVDNHGHYFFHWAQHLANSDSLPPPERIPPEVIRIILDRPMLVPKSQCEDCGSVIPLEISGGTVVPACPWCGGRTGIMLWYRAADAAMTRLHNENRVCYHGYGQSANELLLELGFDPRRQTLPRWEEAFRSRTAAGRSATSARP